MRFNRKSSRPSQTIVVQNMAEDENDVVDEGEKPTTPTSPTEPVGAGGVKIVLADNALKAGSWLKGKVLIEQGLPQVANVSVTVKGVALAQFASDDGKEYKAKNEFLSEVIDLGADIEQRVLLLTPNENNEVAVPFQYRLPLDAPPSFIGNYGSITYECTATVRFSSALTRRRIRKAQFQVLPKRGVNGSIPSTPTVEGSPPITPPQIPVAEAITVFHTPATVLYTHHMSSFGFSDGTVDIQLHTDETNLRRGRTPIHVTLEVSNKTSLHLRDLRFGIMVTMEWNAKGRRITERKTIAEERKDDFCLRPSKEIQLEKEFPPIPTDLPPTIELSMSGANGETGSNAPPVCRCSYSVFAKLIPPNFAKTCAVVVPLNVC